jgi:hypothetical protein
MPAIQPSRLKQQAARLAETFTQPDRFLSTLHDLFEFYANRAHRMVQRSAEYSLLPHYEVSPTVIHQVEYELDACCHKHPEVIVPLADRLWADAYLEVRLVAIYLLGRLPVDLGESVLERLAAWIDTTNDRQLMTALLKMGAIQVHQKHPDWWWNQVRNWCSNVNPGLCSRGIRALTEMSKEDAFDEFPEVFSLANPIFVEASSKLESELVDLLRVLAQRSPSETAYFLKQASLLSSKPDTERLVRRCLPFLAEPYRSNLRSSLRPYPGEKEDEKLR